jgi:hypothetical protein
MTPTDAYDTDLAYIHDTDFDGFARGLAPGLLSLLREAGITDGVVWTSAVAAESGPACWPIRGIKSS